MFSVGDYVVLKGEGLCRVEEIGHPACAKGDPDRLYYCLSPYQDDGRFYIPVDSEGRIRPVIGKEEAEQLIRKAVKAPVSRAKGDRTASSRYRSAILSGEPETIMLVIREIFIKNGKGYVDNSIFREAESILYPELAIALGCEKVQVVDEIRRIAEEK